MLALLFLALMQAGDIDSKDPAVARKAFEEAIRGGDEQALEAAAKTSAQAKLALAEVRAHKRFGENYPPVKLTTFQAKDQPLENCVTDLSKALQIPVDAYSKSGTPVIDPITLDLVDAYPLEAVDKLLNAINAQGWCTLNKGFEYTRGWTRRNPHMLHWRHAAFFPYKLEEERTLDAVGSAGTTCALSVSFRQDGLCRIVGVRPLRSVEAADDRGNPLKLAAEQADPAYYAYNASGNFQIRLAATSIAGDKLGRVRGALPILLPEKRIWKEVPIGGGKIELDLPNLKVTVENILPPGGSARVLFHAVDPKKPHVLPEARDFELQAKDGRRIVGSGAVAWGQKEASLDLTFDLPVGFAGAVLKVGGYETLGEHEIPFEFRDVRIR